MPGPLVHFVEKYYKHGYEQLLLESVNARPTIHTLRMLNRIIYDSSLENKELYIAALRNVAENKNIENSISEVAVEYLSY